MSTEFRAVPSIIQMLRAPFFSSILAPLAVGTLAAVAVTGSFSWIGFVLVLAMGLGLHAATNVYNDIYDTKQGTDWVNAHRNEFSGGSGILVRQPELMPRMYMLARVALVIAFVATVGLWIAAPPPLRPILVGLYLLSAFFAKFYTAAPIKLAYRGLGELSVWFAFGPMAVLVGAVSQGVGFHPAVLALMPPTGLSTLSILWMGQLIDLPADIAGGKRGMVARIGTSAARYGFVLIHILLVISVAAAPIVSPLIGWGVLLVVLPYLLILPRLTRLVFAHHGDPDRLKPAAALNVQLHLGFSLTLVIGLLLGLIL